MVGALVNERCNLVRVLDPVREGRSNKLALNLIFSVKAYIDIILQQFNAMKAFKF